MFVLVVVVLAYRPKITPSKSSLSLSSICTLNRLSNMSQDRDHIQWVFQIQEFDVNEISVWPGLRQLQLSHCNCPVMHFQPQRSMGRNFWRFVTESVQNNTP